MNTKLIHDLYILTQEEAQKIIGGADPNMFNRADWSDIYYYYLSDKILQTGGTWYTYPTFDIRQDGILIRKPGTSGVPFIPYNYGHSSSIYPQEHITGGFLVPYYAFIRFVIAYDKQPNADKAYFLATCKDWMRKLGLTLHNETYEFPDIQSNPVDIDLYLDGHPDFIRKYFPRDRNEIPLDRFNEFDAGYYDFLAQGLEPVEERDPDEQQDPSEGQIDDGHYAGEWHEVVEVEIDALQPFSVGFDGNTGTVDPTGNSDWWNSK